MPLRLVIPLPGPFFYVSSGQRRKPTRRIAGFTPGSAVLAALTVAAVGYGVIHVWWIAVVIGVIVSAVVVATWRGNTIRGDRMAPLTTLRAKITADLAPLRRR